MENLFDNDIIKNSDNDFSCLTYHSIANDIYTLFLEDNVADNFTYKLNIVSHSKYTISINKSIILIIDFDDNGIQLTYNHSVYHKHILRFLHELNYRYGITINKINHKDNTYIDSAHEYADPYICKNFPIIQIPKPTAYIKMYGLKVLMTL